MDVVLSDIPNAPRLSDCILEQLKTFQIHSCGEPILPQIRELLATVASHDRRLNLRLVRLLFNKEGIDESHLNNLIFNRPDIQLEAMYRTEDDRELDIFLGRLP